MFTFSFLKSQCGRTGGRPRGLAGWRQRGSRDGEIQRYVLKGLVSSGHKHSSPSAPASGACTAQQAWIRTKPLITTLPPLAARFLSLSFFFFFLSPLAQLPNPQPSQLLRLTPVNHTRAPCTGVPPRLLLSSCDTTKTKQKNNNK